ncbi:MAG: Rieske 2Fe-2S domain-containing protein [Chloroflexi bacterium]|nr:Rieske 2Fe-2S domain-containing protein [Chloroflexota bacterium]
MATATKPIDLDRRELVPADGLRDFWYPALEDRKVGKKPVLVTMLGEKLCFFRDQEGKVAALWDVCPHRGASLSKGDCHFKGTVACHYHGWVFNGAGECVSVLSEGPNSGIPGKVQARKYPTQTLKGMVFVWMGEGEPAPIEEDVPEEFFQDTSLVLFRTTDWPVNWRVALENSMDSHVYYVHRDSILMLARGPQDPYGRSPRIRPVFTGNGFNVIWGDQERVGNPRRAWGFRDYIDIFRGKFPYQDSYEGLGRWPKGKWRLLWNWIFIPANKRRYNRPPQTTNPLWGPGHHLPGMFRSDSRTHIYTRMCVPIDEATTRIVYYHTTRPSNLLGRIYERVHFLLWHNWVQNIQFSNQDAKVMATQRYDTVEKLSGTDSEIIQWRKLLQRVAIEGRGVLKDLQAEHLAKEMDTTVAEDFAVERLKEQGLEDVPEFMAGTVSGDDD